MDAFEQLVSEILWMDGYWVRTSVKVDLTKEEKVLIGRPSSPRWELDIVAYSGRDNLLRVVECKSYLDSRGVALQFADSGACAPNAAVKLCLACGRIATNADREGLHKYFADKGWDLWDEPWLRQRLQIMSERGYENQVSAVVAKLLLRGRVE